MKAIINQLICDEQGQDLVEYALIVAAVGLALITTVNQLSAGIVSLYQSITGDLSSIGTPAAGRPPGQPREPRFRCLLPDLAFVAAGVALFYCLLLFQGYQQLFRDSDAGW